MKRTPVVTVRTVRPDDVDPIRAFICGLSQRSLYFRFFASAAPPSTALLRTLSGATGADVLVVTDGTGAIIGHGMAAPEPSGGSQEPPQPASIGLVIADQWQRRGLGSALLGLLASRAAQRGVSTLILEVQPANSVMLGMIEHRWPDAPREHTRDAVVIRPAVAASDAVQSGPVPGRLRLLPPHPHPTGALRVHHRTAA